MDDAKERVNLALEKCNEKTLLSGQQLNQILRDSLGKFLFDRTRRRPMILPIIMEV